jgi:hypothetical protein
MFFIPIGMQTFKTLIIPNAEVGVVVHTCNPSTQEAESPLHKEDMQIHEAFHIKKKKRVMSSRPAGAIY